MIKMDHGGKVSNSNGFWPCIGITALNSGGFARKPILIPANQNQRTSCDLQGSVPSTPVSDCEEIDDYTPDYSALEMDTREIIDCFLKQFTGLSHSKCVKKQVVSTMKRVVDSLVMKHEITYNGKWLVLFASFLQICHTAVTLAPCFFSLSFHYFSLEFILNIWIK